MNLYTYRYEIMLECWQEDPHERPSFGDLRTKFGSLLLAGKDDMYIDLRVDDQKAYYNADDEERAQLERRDSVVSSGSEDSYRGKEKDKDEEEEKKATNPYVKTPSVRKPVPPARSAISEGLVANGSVATDDGAYVDQGSSRQVPPRPEGIPLSSLSEQDSQQDRPTPLETPSIVVGVPISSMASQTSTEEGSQNERRSTNPYIDDPGTKQPLRRSQTNPVDGISAQKRALVATASVGLPPTLEEQSSAMADTGATNSQPIVTADTQQ